MNAFTNKLDECNFYTVVDIYILIERCLTLIDGSNKIDEDVWQEMGCQESNGAELGLLGWVGLGWVGLGDDTIEGISSSQEK